ncbi:hypothetical protein HKCCSP123_15380, partial [Rhodobacterales bacterium HKCCSP123]|nr:hypothetical protein [Rhodobacterales bacterium HKCCSP123]
MAPPRPAGTAPRRKEAGLPTGVTRDLSGEHAAVPGILPAGPLHATGRRAVHGPAPTVMTRDIGGGLDHAIIAEFLQLERAV